MITPGPVVITAAFINFLLAGAAGGLIAAAGVFLPPYAVVIAFAPSVRRWAVRELRFQGEEAARTARARAAGLAGR